MKKFAYLLSTLLMVFMFSSCERGINQPACELFDGFVEPCTNWGTSYNKVQIYMNNLGITDGSYGTKIDDMGYIYFKGGEYTNTDKEMTLRASSVTVDLEFNTLIKKFRQHYLFRGIATIDKNEAGIGDRTFDDAGDYFVFTMCAKDLTIIVPADGEDVTAYYFPYHNGKDAKRILQKINLYMK